MNPPTYSKTILIVSLITTGLTARLALLWISGRAPTGALSGGSDAPAYILLGNAISHGKGMAYVGQATALRAPLYPLILGLLDLIFGSYSLLIMRIVQVFVAILTAWVCVVKRQSGSGAKTQSGSRSVWLCAYPHFSSSLLRFRQKYSRPFLCPCFSTSLFAPTEKMNGSRSWAWECALAF